MKKKADKRPGLLRSLRDRKQKRAALLCPVCGKHRFRESGKWEVCPVCGWEDEPLARRDPDFSGGANELSLNEYRQKYLSRKEDADHEHQIEP